MDTLSLAGGSAESLLRQAIRLSLSLEGASWTLSTLRQPARARLLEEGLLVRDGEDCVCALAEVARRLRVEEREAEAYVAAAGLHAVGHRGARTVRGLQVPGAGTESPVPSPRSRSFTPEAASPRGSVAHASPPSTTAEVGFVDLEE